MTGIIWDFDTGDIAFADGEGSNFLTSTIDNQNVALISISQVCRITRPEIGAQITARLTNRSARNVASVLADAVSQAKQDGARTANVDIDTDDRLIFRGTYES